ncbi:MAG: CHAT domain-containing protein [Chloroflexi bacterium]|nr:CHAT domain-containing protein [Chloroflexota bacterium]
MLMGGYADLEIRILELTSEGYPVEITFNGKQEFPRGYLKPDVLPWIPSASATADGERLFNWLLADERLKTAWAEVRGQSPQRRIRLRLDTAAPELHAIPWELLRDIGPGLTPQTLAADTDTPFSRYLAGQWRSSPPIFNRPIKLLIAIANPSNLAEYGLAPLDIEAERQLLTEAVSGLAHKQLQLTFLKPPVTLSALETELKRGYHLLHLVGHGFFNQQRGQAVLYLANKDNRVKRISESALAGLLARQEKSLRLVFLAGCQTASRSPADAFRGFAPQLIEAGVPAVVAMQDLVSVAAAREFTGVFYRQLLQHGQVDLAGNEARSALLAAGRADSWAVPALYARASQIIEPLPEPPSVARRLAKVTAVMAGLLLIVALLSSLAYYIWFLLPMPDSGFNIAVAQFSMADETTGALTVTPESKELSNWLFAAIEKEANQLPAALRVEIRAPSRVNPIRGNAAEMAEQLNATLLIYGLITQHNGSYSVQPEFYVLPQESFTYGSEVAGPERLGQPVPFNLPLDDPGVLFGLNEKLNARIQALQNLVSGLAYFYVNHYDEASAKFQQAAAVEGWEEDEGQEVAYLLMGAAKLRVYGDPKTDLDQRTQALNQALEAFRHASELNPDYARSYLGLGTITLQQATVLNPNWPDHLDTAKLIEAESWYSKSLSAADQPALAYVPIKAAFGLGQVQRLQYEYGLSERSGKQARNFFEEVIAAYNTDKSPVLIWFAGHAYADLGRLAGLDRDWPEMVSKYREAIDILYTLPGGPPFNWIADYRAEVAFAHEKLGQLGKACEDYRQAIQMGSNTVGSGQTAINQEKLNHWKAEVERLTKGGAC